ncbi:MAG: hypothetical protein NTW12_12215 [Deltaproteobacteria bacterium]|nr:hypothetical protein [Deltaproteobacteria bacterium]
MLLKERRKGDCGNAINSKGFGNSGGSYAGRPSESESLWKKMIGKPYSGKPNVRFDEGELEIEHSATTPALYSTVQRTGFIHILSRSALLITNTKREVTDRVSLLNPV